MAVPDPFATERILRFPGDNRRMRKRALRIGSKEPGTVAWLDGCLRPGDRFWDVGANMGIYSLFAAVRLEPGSVFAFEPHAANFASLVRTVALNPEHRIEPLAIALDAEDGFLDFAYHRLDAGSTGSQLASSPVRVDHVAPAVERKAAFAADALVARSALPAPTVVKIDVDGAEGRILEGMQGLLAAGTVRTLQVEVNPGQRSAISTRLEAAGYRCTGEHYSAAGRAHVERSPDEEYPVNLVFERAGEGSA